VAYARLGICKVRVPNFLGASEIVVRERYVFKMNFWEREKEEIMLI
jgi:hypothetical protein